MLLFDSFGNKGTKFAYPPVSSFMQIHLNDKRYERN